MSAETYLDTLRRIPEKTFAWFRLRAAVYFALWRIALGWNPGWDDARQFARMWEARAKLLAIHAVAVVAIASSLILYARLVR